MEDGRCGRSLEIAASFGIEVSDTDPFWKDRTFLELNYAVSEWRPPKIYTIAVCTSKEGVRTTESGFPLLGARLWS